MNAIEHLHKIAKEAMVLPEIGDYVRTEKGTITKFNIHDILLNKFENRYYYTYDTCCEDSVSELVIKSSPNIIDLIEAGDYVNGHLVIKRHNDLMLEDTFDLVQDEDIKTIVTKEQFENCMYKVGE